VTARRRTAGQREPAPDATAAAEVFDDLRPLLFAIAYRMLGSVAEAEDIVQEAFLRYHRAFTGDGPAGPDSPKAYLSAVTTRLCVDHARSARVRRETYVGQWLPEPMLTDLAAPDPASLAEQSDTMSMAFLLLLERLSPVERAVFLLRRLRLRLRRGGGDRRPARERLPAARLPRAQARRGRAASLRGVAAEERRARRPVLLGHDGR
jgi:RNA polymerase sigma factor (sigma-70 family)